MVDFPLPFSPFLSFVCLVHAYVCCAVRSVDVFVVLCYVCSSDVGIEVPHPEDVHLKNVSGAYTQTRCSLDYHMVLKK